MKEKRGILMASDERERDCLRLDLGRIQNRDGEKREWEKI